MFHSGHRPLTVCFAQAAERLPIANLLGIFLHEMGHIVAARLGAPHHQRHTKPGPTPQRVQMEADIVAGPVLNFNTYTYADNTLEWVDPREFTRKERDGH